MFFKTVVAIFEQRVFASLFKCCYPLELRVNCVLFFWRDTKYFTLRTQIFQSFCGTVWRSPIRNAWPPSMDSLQIEHTPFLSLPTQKWGKVLCLSLVKWLLGKEVCTSFYFLFQSQNFLEFLFHRGSSVRLRALRSFVFSRWVISSCNILSHNQLGLSCFVTELYGLPYFIAVYSEVG